MGRPKQLLLYEGGPLVARAVQAALMAGADPVAVVLGAHAEAVLEVLDGFPVIPVVNPEWHRGIGTSIAAGVRAIIEQEPLARAVLITLADQPLVTDAALRRLLHTWAGSGASIAAAEYAGIVGVPAVFGRVHVDALRSLPPGEGATQLLRRADIPVARVAMRRQPWIWTRLTTSSVMEH
jgi:molybdenum cofactor cytidylyltransferase